MTWVKVYYWASSSWNLLSNVALVGRMIQAYDTTGFCQVLVADFESALFATFNALEKVPMRIDDENDVQIFIGRLFAKIYNAHSMGIQIRGNGSLLEDARFKRNYLYFDGRVKDVRLIDELELEEKDSEGNWVTPNFVNDQFNLGDQDKGILITDQNVADSVAWTAVIDGDVTIADMDAQDAPPLAFRFFIKNDGLTLSCTDTTPWDGTVEVVANGGVFADTKAVRSITVKYRMKSQVVSILSIATCEVILELWNRDTTAWEEIAKVFRGSTGTTWKEDENLNIPIPTDGALTDYLRSAGGNQTDMLFRFSFHVVPVVFNPTVNMELDYLSVTIIYDDNLFSPISEKITDTVATGIIGTTGNNFQTDGVHGSDEAGFDGDLVQIGESAINILSDAVSDANMAVIIDVGDTKYIPRDFTKGFHCISVVNEIKKVFNAKWYENHLLDRIGIKTTDNFVDSTVDVDETDFQDDWQYEDKSNAVRGVEVFGRSSTNISAEIENTTSGEFVTEWKTFVFDSITSSSDAQEMAESIFAELVSAQPSIKIRLKGTNPLLLLGTTIDITLARPSVAKTAYPIRMIERFQDAHSQMWTTIWAGLGRTEDDERLGKLLRDIGEYAHRAHADKLRSGATGGITAINIGQVIGLQSALDAKLAIAGGTMTGDIDMDKNELIDIGRRLDLYSDEAGKTDWRMTFSMDDADNPGMWVWDVGGAVYKKFWIGRNLSGIEVDAPNKHIDFSDFDVTVDQMHYCEIISNANQAIANGGAEEVDFDTIVSDPNSMADVANERITIQKDGNYIVYGQIYYLTNPNGYRYFSITLNTVEQRNIDIDANGHDHTRMIITWYFHGLSAGDDIGLFTGQNSGAALNILGDTGTTTNFMTRLIVKEIL